MRDVPHVPSLPWSGTFHSVGARILREFATSIGLDPAFTVQDRGDSEDLMALVRSDLGCATTKERFPAKATCLAIYSHCVNSERPLDDVLRDGFTWCVPWERELRALFGRYVEAKQAHNVLDFDDLLLYWVHLVEEGALGRDIGARFDHVLVDEYQDTNRLQARVLRALKPDGAGMTVVGDDAQAIYSFRAASVRNILDFPAQFTPEAQVVVLDINYRSTQPILDASNAVMDAAADRYTKNLRSERAGAERPELVTVRDETDQAQCVAEHILALRETGIALNSQAVLFRTNAHAAQLELELARRRIPYVKYGGLRFLDAAHVKDVLAVLRFADNPRGRIAGFRALQLVTGVGPATANRVLDACNAADVSMALASCGMSGESWSSFVELFAALRAAPEWPSEMDRLLRWYEPQLERMYDDAAARAADLAQLKAVASAYSSREHFLTELALDPPAAISDEARGTRLDDDYLVLSTIHSAKGQEWKAVQILNAVDGCIPSDMASATTEQIDEERRLLYVAMTRARDHLRILVPQRFYVHAQNAYGDRYVHASRSRFLPDDVASLFTCRTWPDIAASEAVMRAAEPRAKIDIAARVRAAWR